jgi:dihydropteroate synthase
MTIRRTRHPDPTVIGPGTFRWGERTFIVGILNVTPDSFSGDGLLAHDDVVDRAVAQARQMVEEGADLLDVGGESTRPGHTAVDAAEEIERVVPVLRAVRAALPATPLSIDTTKPAVAEAALAAGADLLNDIWGTGAEPAMVELAADRHVPVLLMHNRAVARYDDVVAEVTADLGRAIERAVRLGVAEGDIVVDPGIGFGKTADHNVTLLRGLAALGSLGRPILLGTSRKSTLGRILDLPPDQRLEGTLATTALGIASGIDLVRVHDVQPNVRTARVADAIIRATWHSGSEGGPP